MRRAFIAIAAIALLATAPASNLVIDDSTLSANAAGNYTLATTPPADHNVVTYATFKTYVVNKTCSVPFGNPQAMDWQTILSCASGHSVSQQTTTISGTAVAQTACGAPCKAAGGSETPASPYVVTMQINSVSSANPVALNMTLAHGGTYACSYTLTDGAGTTQASGGNTSSPITYTPTVTIGATGTWTLTVSQSGTVGDNCTASGTLKGYQ